MIGVLSRISLYFSLVIVLLHGVIPHYHEGEIGSRDHLAIHEHKDEGVWQRIAFAFHEQSSTEEFSQFNLNDEFELDDLSTVKLELISVLTTAYAVLFFQKQEPSFSSHTKAQELYFKSTIDLRGPPVVIS